MSDSSKAAGTYPDIRCYGVPSTTHQSRRIAPRMILVSFFGQYSLKLSALANLMVIESGIINWYIELSRYIDKSKTFASLRSRINVKEITLLEYYQKTPWPFTLTDWKILSIFIVWGSFLTAAVFLFAAEKFYMWKTRSI